MSYEYRGVVVRTVANSLAYLEAIPGGRSYSFTPDVIDSYHGESFEELKLSCKTHVSFSVDSESGTVRHVKIENQVRERGGFQVQTRSQTALVPTIRSESIEDQAELHPDNEPNGSIVAIRALSPTTRKFGKLINTEQLRVGDLLLTREVRVDDFISRHIVEVQSEGGYHTRDAKWTHAAMYLGDGTNVVEATVDGVLAGGDVRLTSLDRYCDGTSVLRFRRPLFITEDSLAWKMCVRALSRLKEPYDIIGAAKMWYDVIVKKGGFFDDKKRATSRAVVCSTLYADSYNEATRQTLGEVNGLCVPAWLSLSDKFTDVQVDWLEII